MRMRAASKMVTNPNGHTSNVVGAIFAFALIGGVIGFFLSLIG